MVPQRDRPKKRTRKGRLVSGAPLWMEGRKTFPERKSLNQTPFARTTPFSPDRQSFEEDRDSKPLSCGEPHRTPQKPVQASLEGTLPTQEASRKAHPLAAEPSQETQAGEPSPEDSWPHQPPPQEDSVGRGGGNAPDHLLIRKNHSEPGAPLQPNARNRKSANGD
jgi:hypothetical protein